MVNDNSLEKIDIDSAAKVVAATAMSSSISFCLERKYLGQIEETPVDNTLQQSFALNITSYENRANDSYWIAIDQIGRPLGNQSDTCFSAIQKILHSFFLPNTQLLFLVYGSSGENKLFLGIRFLSVIGTDKRNSYLSSIDSFIKNIWPGISTRVIEGNKEELSSLSGKLKNNKLNNVIALTGIPSMDSQYETLYPATIDNLIAGMNGKNYAYLVIADPIDGAEVERMLYQCRDMCGRAESLKQLNVSANQSDSLGMNTSYSRSENWSKSISESISRKDYGGAAIARGLQLSETWSPVVRNVIDAVGAIGHSAIKGISVSSKNPLLSVAAAGIDNLVGQRTEGSSKQKGGSEGQTEGNQFTHTQGQTLSYTICNKHAEAIAEQLDYHTKRLEVGKAIGLWEVGAYLLTENSSDTSSGSNLLRSILSGNESYLEPIREHDISNLLSRKEPPKNLLFNSKQTNNKRERTYLNSSLGVFRSPNIGIQTPELKMFSHPLGPRYNSLKTVLTTKELSYLVNFPLRTVPGISVVDSSAEFSLNKLNSKSEGYSKFGKLINGGTTTQMEYNLSIDSLSKHTLLCGINGTGKTNTVQSILNSIGKTPFLIIEPAKTEYVDWASEYNSKNPEKPIKIFMPNCKRYLDGKGREVKLDDLHINPFEIVWLNEKQEPNVWSHIDRVKSAFAAAFPMYDILPVLLEKLIYATYQANRNCKWIGAGAKPIYQRTPYPTLDIMSGLVNEVIDKIGYQQQIAANMKACLNTRIENLSNGWRGKMLNCPTSTSWEELFRTPCVINLSYVGDDVDKSFIMSLILQFMYEFCQAKAELRETNFNDNKCQHLTIIEEAHRVMMKCDNPDMPQYKTAMTFSNMLSEIRAYGEGLFLVDQVPTRLVPDAIKNTNTKIVHRLVSEDDCRAMAESMALSDEQKKMIPKLLVGQCIVSTSLSTDKHWVLVNKSK